MLRLKHKDVDVIKSREKINPRQIQKSYLDKIEDSVTSLGVPIFEPGDLLNINSDYLSLPREVTELPSKVLGEYLNAYTQQKLYLRTVLSRSELVTEECRRAYFNSTKEHYKSYSSDKKLTETAKEKLINSLPDVLPYYEEYLDAQNKEKIVSRAIENIEDVLFMLSREVTRRSSDFENMNREHIVSRKTRW